MKFKLPDFLRPVVGPVVAGVVAIGLSKIPAASAIVDPHVVQTSMEAWIFAHLFKQAMNVKINPTNAAAPSLSSTVPAAVLPKSDLAKGQVAGTTQADNGI